MTNKTSPNAVHKRNASQAQYISDMWGAIYGRPEGAKDNTMYYDQHTMRTHFCPTPTERPIMPETKLEVDTTDTTTSGGVKYDSGKVAYHLFPFEAFDEINKVLAFGASKYAERNWENGINFNRLFNSTLRHLFSWWRGENLDPETNLSHLAHAATNVIFLLAFVLRKQAELDNRPETHK